MNSSDETLKEITENQYTKTLVDSQKEIPIKSYALRNFTLENFRLPFHICIFVKDSICLFILELFLNNDNKVLDWK